MVLVDYFSWQRERDSDDEPYGLVTVCFCSFEAYLSHLVLDILNVYSTRSKAKEAGVIDPHVKPKHQKPKTQPRPARSAPSFAQNIAKKLVSEVLKPSVDQLLE